MLAREYWMDLVRNGRSAELSLAEVTPRGLGAEDEADEADDEEDEPASSNPLILLYTARFWEHVQKRRRSLPQVVEGWAPLTAKTTVEELNTIISEQLEAAFLRATERPGSFAEIDRHEPDTRLVAAESERASMKMGKASSPVEGRRFKR